MPLIDFISRSGKALRRAAVPLFLLLAAQGAIAEEEMVVITNLENTNVIDRAYVIKVYTGAVKGWPDGSPIFLLDYGQDSELRKIFYAKVIGKSPAAMRAIWSQNIFTGKAMPPRVTQEDSEMKRIVAGNRNAIGYIRASQIDRTVKVIDR
jgi:ABC-type phosphate transport system substrate-binding protein